MLLGLGGAATICLKKLRHWSQMFLTVNDGHEISFSNLYVVSPFGIYLPFQCFFRSLSTILCYLHLQSSCLLQLYEYPTSEHMTMLYFSWNYINHLLTQKEEEQYFYTLPHTSLWLTYNLSYSGNYLHMLNCIVG